jgi:hypothetical protein
MREQLRLVVIVLLLAGFVGASAASTAAALERGIVYSKTMEGETSPGGGEPELVGGLYVLRGERPRRLTYDPDDQEPNVARNGTIAFVRGGDVYLVRPDDSGLRQLTAGPELDERPLFSPDGSHLVFTRRAAPGAPRDLYAIGLDGTPPQPLVVSLEDDLEAAFSRDGQTLVFVRRLSPAIGEAGGDLYAIGLDGTRPRQLTRTAEDESRPHYFAGGILFNRRPLDGGGPDIYGMRRDGTRVRLALVKKPRARIEVVSPDGRLLLFRTRGRIWAKRLAAGRSFPARKVSGFPGVIYDLALSPDKREIAFLFYFDEQLALCSIDLRTGDFNIDAEVYNAGGEGGIDPKIAW